MKELTKVIPQGPVIDHVDRINDLINELVGELGQLGDRLAPVLLPPLNDAAEKSECRAIAVTSPLSERLDSLGDKLHRRIATVRDLLDRLEI